MKIEKHCENCGIKFNLRQRSQVGRFCSRKCQNILQVRRQCERREERKLRETYEEKIEKLRIRFEKFVVIKEKDCWSWIGATSSGYGNMCFEKKVLKAHRISWMLYKGKIAPGMHVLHKCDVRICTNPEHLYLGTNQDNMNDKQARNRSNPRCKLTPKEVFEIRNLITLEIPMTKIAKRYNVSNVTVWGIKHRIYWKHLK